MSDLTLESLARRIDALERALELKSPPARAKDWRSVVGMFGDSEFMRRVDAEGQAIREAERAEARGTEQSK
jgi:hypothetical protein